MSKRRRADGELTAEFHRLALKQGTLMPCWLAQFDEHERPCSGQVEAIHLIGRQRVRNVLVPLFVGVDRADVEDLVELAEWDHRNAMTGCTTHHRPFDSHSTPGLTVPGLALPARFLEFAEERALESDAERKFPGLVFPT